MISFDNTLRAFVGKTDNDLKRAKLLFSAISIPLFTNIGGKIVFFLLKARIPVRWFIKPTIYKQFVGGETIDECINTANRISKYNVKCILDFAAEGLDSDEEITETLVETLRTIEEASKSPDIPFAVFKPSAFIRKSALNSIEIGQGDTPDIKNAKTDFENRVDILCKRASELDVPIMVDAEESWFQDYYDEVVLRLMCRYNKQKAIVYNTLQMYRTDRYEYLQTLIKASTDESFYLGIKFVRGAYMEKERQLAAKYSYPSPVYSDKNETDNAFNNALCLGIEHVDRLSLFSGTHNEESCYLLCKLLNEKMISPNNNRVWFSQLYGMSDHISFNLADEGFNVAKYLPYGPVRLLVPYLMRRATENTSIAGQTGRELALIKTEEKRRKIVNY